MHPSARTSYKKTKRRFVFLGILTVFFLWFALFFVHAWRTSVFLTEDFRTSIVLKTSPIVVISFTQESLTPTLIVTVPQDLTVVVPHGYGLYKVSSLWRLGEIENRPALFSETITDLLATPVNNWIGGQSPAVLSETEILASLKKNFNLTQILKGDTDTNLSLFDRLLFGWKVMQLKSNNTLLYSAHSNKNIFTMIELPDGSMGRTINSIALDEFLEQKFEIESIRSNGFLIKVFNTTDISGVGNKFARFITNAGGKVIAVDNEQKPDIVTCHVVIQSSQKNSALVAFLSKKMNCSVEEAQNTQDSDLNIYVGKDFSDRWK